MKFVRMNLWSAAAFFAAAILAAYFVPRLVGTNSASLSQNLEEFLTVIRTNRVVGYRDQDWCRYVQIDNQLYADPPTDPSVACLTNRSASVPFTADARAIFEKIHRATKTAGVDLLPIDVDYGQSGAIETATLLEDQSVGHDSYYFDSKDRPPGTHTGTVARLGKGWYHYQGQ